MPGAKLAIPERWELLRERRYGATEVAYFQKRRAENSQADASDPE